MVIHLGIDVVCTVVGIEFSVCVSGEVGKSHRVCVSACVCSSLIVTVLSHESGVYFCV